MSDLTNGFVERLAKLREEFPMCYVEAWTPDDFQKFVYPVDEDEEDAPQADWQEPIHAQIALVLGDTFDAGYGTNWERVESVVFEETKATVLLPAG